METDPPTIEDAALDDPVAAHRTRGMIFLGLAVAAVGFGLHVQMGMNANFVGEEMKITAYQQGVLEAYRESCGILALLVLAGLAGLAEPLVGAAMLVLTAVGLGAYAYVPSYFWLVAWSLVWSQGLHVWMPLPNSMALALAEPGRQGHRLGQIRAAGAVGSALGLAVVLTLHKLGVHIRPLWLVAGAAVMLGAAACLGIPRRIKTPGPRLVLRRKYALYYALCLLEGWRKQIFVAFAGYLLVTKYGVPLERMLILWIVIQAIGWVASPLVGRVIDRVGERPVLVFYYACLTCFFVGYAYVPNATVLQILFVVDCAFFVLVMALTTYVSRIAPPAEHTPTLSMGVAMNHVSAVLMPLVGGLLWRHFGPRWAFLAGAAAAVISIAVATLIPSKRAQREPGP